MYFINESNSIDMSGIMGITSGQAWEFVICDFPKSLYSLHRFFLIFYNQHSVHEYKIHNAEVLFREDCTLDDFVDVVIGNRLYMKCVYCYNKVDQITIEEVDRLAREPYSTVISSKFKLNLDYLVEYLWENLGMVRVWTKKPGNKPDFDDGVILRDGATVEHCCHSIHRSIAQNFKYALVWGRSVKFSPQRVNLPTRFLLIVFLHEFGIFSSCAYSYL